MKKQRHAVAVIALMLGAAGAYFFSPVGARLFGPSSGEETLLRASRNARFRPSLLRLSGAFPYRPAEPLVRGERGDSNSERWKFLKVVADLENADRSAESVENLHTMGVSLFLAGNPEGALHILKRALHRAATAQTPAQCTPALWNDIAVVYYELAKRGEARYDVVALDAAEKAWASSHSTAIAWTRAILLEQLNLRNAASTAWGTYLKLDSTSPWAAEARERIASRAHEHAQVAFTPAIRAKLLDACARGDIESARVIVHAHPKEARTLGEDELLPAWAAAAGHDSAEELRLLRTLRTLGATFQAVSGEALLADVVAAIDSTRNPARRRATVAAILEYGAGRKAYAGQQVSVAERRLRNAEEQLRAVDNPLALLANVYCAAMVYSSNRYADVVRTIDVSADSSARIDRYHALRGLRGWVTGLAYAQTGRPAASVESYERALDGFRQAGEQLSVAATLHLRAETLDYMTATDEAWVDRMAGIEMFRDRTVSARPMVWMNVVMAAVRDHLDYAANAVADEVMVDAQRSGDAMWMTEAGMWRAVARSRMGDPFSQDDLEAIRQSLARIEDPSIRARSEANLQLVTGEIRATTAAAPEVDKALQFYAKSEDRFNGMTALAQRASERAAAADFAKADASLITALGELERQTRDVADPFQRALFTERARTMFLLASQVQLMRGRPAAALWFSDRSRQVALQTFAGSLEDLAPTGLDAETLGAKLVAGAPRGTTIVYQDLQDEQLLTWVIREGKLIFVKTPMASSTLLADIDQFVSDIRGPRGEGVLPQAKKLYATLLGPVRDHIGGTELLVYSPGPILRGLPIAALHDGRHFLAQSRPVAITRALSFLSSRPMVSLSDRSTALVTLPEPGPGAPYLTGARAEAVAVADVYAERGTTLLGSAATREAFMTMVTDYDVIHVGGHGRTDRRPLQNAIEFGAKRIRAYDVMGLSLRRRPIVVLAGCRTDDETEGRATLSLSSAFVAAGASAVVGSLWDVEDQDTARLVTEFHRNMARGVSAAEALHRAQQSFISRQHKASSWAAFQLQM